jgi:hypothetical protein
MVYLKSLSAAQTIQQRMIGSLINNEFENNERKLSPNLRHYVGIFLVRRRKTTKESVRTASLRTEIQARDFLNTIHGLQVTVSSSVKRRFSNSTGYIVSINDDYESSITWKKWHRSTLKYFYSIFCQETPFWGQDSNPRLPTYDEVVTTTRRPVMLQGLGYATRTTLRQPPVSSNTHTDSHTKQTNAMLCCNVTTASVHAYMCTDFASTIMLHQGDKMMEAPGSSGSQARKGHILWA